MNKQDFIHLYWKIYISIEKEFAETLNYVSLDVENYGTFSSSYIKILLQVGSEIDIVAKSICNYHEKSFKGENINDYRPVIMKHETDFSNTEVKILQIKEAFSIKPWEIWGVTNKNDVVENPSWWKVYNKVKHDRHTVGTINDMSKEYYKFANLEYTLYSLAGLYQLLIYYYYDLAPKDRIQVPLPGSRLFTLSGGKWDDIVFYKDISFYIDFSDGHLYSESGEFVY